MSDPSLEVRKKAHRIRQHRHRPLRLFEPLAQVGVLGWLFILPAVALAYLGHRVARSTGTLWPAVVGVVFGIGLGGYVMWRNVRRSLEAPEAEDMQAGDPEVRNETRGTEADDA